MTLASIQRQLLPEIEEQLKLFLHSFDFGPSQALQDMLIYHMGWGDEDSSHGKRIRPLLTLLTAGACNGNTLNAMPAAIAIEYLHNFTLIHDDIEDDAAIRHGRKTLWEKWGLAQGINAGDALFSIAQLAMVSLEETCTQPIVLEAIREFNLTCLHLTRGQYLDIAFESSGKIYVEAYFDMIRAKTAALLSFAAYIGGLTAHQEQPRLGMLAKFGEALGMAFQIQDDYLGIWGNPKITGKSAANDLKTKKKTLPIIYGLQHNDEFNKIWNSELVSNENVEALARLLTQCGAQDFTKSKAKHFTNLAFSTLKYLFPKENNYSKAIFELTEILLNRDF